MVHEFVLTCSADTGDSVNDVPATTLTEKAESPIENLQTSSINDTEQN